MKKIFTLIAVAAMALSANAQSVIDYTAIKDGEFTIANATLNSASTTAKKMYDIDANAELDMYMNSAQNIHFQITNGSAKAKIFTVGVNTGETTDKGFIEFGGKNGIIYISGLAVGDVVKMQAASKGSTAASVSVLNSSNAVIASTTATLPVKAKGAEGADADGYVWKEYSFTVTEDMFKSIESVPYVRIKETAGGYRLKVIAINADLPSGIETVKAANAAKNAAAYNLAGQKVNDAFKGVVVKDGKKFMNK